MGPNGFAAIVNEELDPGSTLDVELTMEGLSASATARVQTINRLRDGRFRCGFFTQARETPAHWSGPETRRSFESDRLGRLFGKR